MANMRESIQNIAQQIPGYGGYQSKERRRDADKVLRERLASQYERLLDLMNRLAQAALGNKNMSQVEQIERAGEQLQRFVTRLRVAPRGYAGWFDAAQIQEADLDQLYQFDSMLATGVDKLKAALDAVSTAIESNTRVEAAIATAADVIAELNSRLDAREEFLALGKRPAPTASPLGALKAAVRPTTGETAFEQLKQGDAVSYDGSDYVVTGRIVYSVSSGKFSAYPLQDRDPRRWLRVGPNQELAILQEIDLSLPSPLPETISYSGKNYTQAEEGVANVTVEGASGIRSGSVNYSRFAADGGGRLWVEDWGTETKVQVGQTVDPMELKLYRKL